VLASANYTATDGANVILNTGAPLNDEIQVLAFSSFTVANAVTWDGGTMQGALQLFGGDTGVTPTPGDNSTKLSTTAFVQAGFAQLSGLSTQTFSMAAATLAAHGVNLGMFGSSLAANGYQKLPSGLIIQWGLSGAMSGSTFATVSVTFPIAFPNAGLQCFATSTGAGVSTAAGGASTTGVTLTNSTTATSPARWLAIGY
jgi:hypothetical protein